MFKVLSAIAAWVLWICGLLMGFTTLVLGIMRGHLFAVNPPELNLPYDPYVGWFALALAYAIGAVVIMVLRKKLE
jgi:hypothetical protein